MTTHRVHRALTIGSLSLAAAISAAGIIATPVFAARASPVSSGPTSGGTQVTFPLPGAGTRVADAAGRRGAVYELADDGAVWAVGSNFDGQLGTGATQDSLTETPVRVVFPSSVRIVDLEAGLYFAVALDDTGSVWTWGLNTVGQLGDGSTINYRALPVRVDGLQDRTITDIAAGAFHTTVVASDGTSWSWGNDDRGQLGDGGPLEDPTTRRAGLSRTPVQTVIPGARAATTVTAGYWYSIATASDGTMWAWGDNVEGQLGDGTTDLTTAPTQVQGLAGERITDIAAGDDHTLARTKNGTVWAWGNNTSGALGDGTTTDRSIPAKVASLSAHSVTEVTAGTHYSAAITNVGSVFTWGRNTAGTLGHGTLLDSASPSRVDSLRGTPIRTVHAAGDLVTATAVDGGTFAWGDTTGAPFGDQSPRTAQTTPLQLRTVPFTAADVRFGGISATDITVSSPGVITATLPST